MGNQKARTAVRNTWANKYNLDTLYNFTVRVAFLLGQSDNETLNVGFNLSQILFFQTEITSHMQIFSYFHIFQNSVTEESEKYNDIIQERFLDTYNNLTLKSVMLLKWASSNCEATKYLMKTDDDMFINIPKLIELLNARPKRNETLIGCLICNAKPISDPKNKW